MKRWINDYNLKGIFIGVAVGLVVFLAMLNSGLTIEAQRDLSVAFIGAGATLLVLKDR